MRSKSVFSSCAILVLSAVISTGWAYGTPPTSYPVDQQKAEQAKIDAAKAAADAKAAKEQADAEREAILDAADENPDTNTIMKSREQALIDAQTDAAGRDTNAANLLDDTKTGTTQADIFGTTTTTGTTGTGAPTTPAVIPGSAEDVCSQSSPTVVLKFSYSSRKKGSEECPKIVGANYRYCYILGGETVDKTGGKKEDKWYSVITCVNKYR